MERRGRGNSGHFDRQGDDPGGPLGEARRVDEELPANRLRGGASARVLECLPATEPASGRFQNRGGDPENRSERFRLITHHSREYFPADHCWIGVSRGTEPGRKDRLLYAVEWRRHLRRG